jgi:hypothetical protein
LEVRLADLLVADLLERFVQNFLDLFLHESGEKKGFAGRKYPGCPAASVS